MYLYISYFGLIILLLLSPANSFAEEFVFETNSVHYIVNSAGLNVSLEEKKTGKNWLKTDLSPFAYAFMSGKKYSISRLVRDGEYFLARFGKSGITASYQFTTHPTHITIELKSISGGSPGSVQLSNIKTTPFQNAGSIIAARWNGQFTVCLMALSERVHSRLGRDNTISSTVYQEFGMVGEKAALIAVPTSQFLDVVQEVERAYNLPSPTIDGQWAKLSPDVHTNYLFTKLSERTAEHIITYAKLGGFSYVLVPWSSWAGSRGSYPINRKNFPSGEEGLKATIEMFHAEGIKVGMHMLTSFVDKNDALVNPKPDDRLLRLATTRLAHDINENESTIDAIDELKAFSDNKRLYMDLSKYGSVVKLDDEIIRCDDINVSRSIIFSQCKRGLHGTKADMHESGARIDLLAQVHGSYLADLKTSLKEQIAERIADVVNRCGFDMIYFDGGELNKANGPAWYWVGQQQTAIWKRLKRDVLLQGSGMSHWLWHVIARGTCDDHAAIAVKSYMDHHKLKRLRNYRDNFMPAELGWCGLLSGGVDHPATTVSDMEHYGTRMIAFNAPISIQTNLKKLEGNKQTNSILKKLKQIDELRRSVRISEPQREQLKTGNWTLFDASGNVALKSVKPEGIQHTSVRSQTKLKNPNERKSGAGTDIPSAFNGKDRSLFQGERLIGPPDSIGRAFRSGSLICSVYFTGKGATETDCRNPLNPLENTSPIALQDLRNHQVLAVTISVKGHRKYVQPPYPVLNIQLEDNRTWFRDHYIDLDFTGEKTIIISQTNVERLLSEFEKPVYNIKKTLRYFNYSKVAALHLRWMRRPENQGMAYSVLSVRAIRK